jgi:CDP-glucose 4,6-dehydratase
MNLKLLNKFFCNKKVLITGHTGFKGTWLSTILLYFKVNIIGFSISIPTRPNYFSSLSNKIYKDIRGDVRNFTSFSNVINKNSPDIIYHLAAQSLVFDSYNDPYKTFSTNYLGILNLLEILKDYKKKISVVIVTSDKSYKNLEITRGYREDDILGGDDPYSASKGSSEILINSYIKSFLRHKKNIKISVVRAGNVVGGGDWSSNRIVPDFFKSQNNKTDLFVRNPHATRPWQHVIEPLVGYISLSYHLSTNKIHSNKIYNLGPNIRKNMTVKNVLEFLNNNSTKKVKIKYKKNNIPESKLLFLNSNLINKEIGWKCYLKQHEVFKLTSDWYNYYYSKDKSIIFDYTTKQIHDYLVKYYE